MNARVPIVLSIALLFSALCGAGASTPNPAASGVDSYAQLRDLFAKPPAEFSTAPFFVWNGEMTEAEIDKHLTSYQAQGIRAFFIHPRPGMITPYLSDRWFELCRYTVDKAKQLGMVAWLYDENSYPSGFAGGHVPAQMPESWNEGQSLILQKLTEFPADASKFKIILKKAGGAFEDVTANASREQGQKGDYYAFELGFYPKGPWFGGFNYVDLIRPGVTEKFIDVTMKGYERTLGADLGKTSPGIFTDEPNINPPGGKFAIRWTPDLFDQFSRRWGYDLRPRLASLYEPVGEWQRVRHNYYSTLLDLFIDRWAKPWFQYAESKGFLWTGHYWEHGWPSPGQGPDNMAMYAWFHVPGIDMLFNQFRETYDAQFGNVRAVKELASVANQMGQRRTLSETYGGAGWELRFEDMKRLGDWEYALGVNLMNQHLAFQTLIGARKHDYPQSFTYHEPWWNDYHVLADYYTRLSFALSAGQQVNKVLVIEPTTSAWMYSATSASNPHRDEIGVQFQAFVTRLEKLQGEYDLGSENIIKDRGKVQGARFVVGQRAYDLVVLAPGTENLDSPTVKLLGEYLQSGGQVLSFVEPPARVDGSASAQVKDLASQYAPVWHRVDSLENSEAQSALLTSGITGVTGEMLHQRRQLNGGELLFFVNQSLENQAAATVKVSGKSLVALNPFDGTIAPHPGRREGNSVVFSFNLPPAGSLLVAALPEGPAPMAPKAAPAERTLTASSAPSVKRVDPNVLSIDYCDLTLGGKTTKDMFYFNAAEEVFRHYGFKGDPWNTSVQYKTSILDKNNFPADSGFEAAFHFDVESDVDASAFRAVVERPHLWHVAINGTPVEARPGEWWLDRAFGVYDIGQHVKAGQNTITVTARPMSVHSELTQVYVLGQFSVTGQSKGWKITAPQQLAMGAWKQQGLPFYSGSVTYSRRYPLMKGAHSWKVRLGNWHGTVTEVKVNGQPAGVIGWQPYELDVTPYVQNGDNFIEISVIGSLKNLLGPHHGKIRRGLSDPGSFHRAPENMPPASGYDLDAYGLMDDFQLVEVAKRP